MFSVDYRVVAPKDRGAEEFLPLILVLHGAGSSAKILDSAPGVYQEMFDEGSLPRCLIACASTATRGGHYIDWPDGGKWETLVAEEFPAYLESEYRADLSRVALFGASMGGYGALKIAFRHPERYRGVAALAPTVFPRERAEDVPPRNRIGELQYLLGALSDHPSEDVLYRLRENQQAVKNSGLDIYIDCGDNDAFFIHDGAEYLHRTLWDLDIGHEYRLLHDVDHVGPSSAPRRRVAFEFLGRSLREPSVSLDESVLAEVRAWVEGGKNGPPPRIDHHSDTGVAALRLMIAPQVAAAALEDPTVSRRFGIL